MKYDRYPTAEEAAAEYILPDPLRKEDSSRVTTPAEWPFYGLLYSLFALKQQEYVYIHIELCLLQIFLLSLAFPTHTYLLFFFVLSNSNTYF